MSEDSITARESAGVSIARPTSPLRHLRYVIQAMRPKQWVKSGIVLMAFFFSVNQDPGWTPGDPATWEGLLIRSLITMLIFAVVSGADYLINDVRDRESDRMHPRKSRRPIAAGLLSPQAAIIWAAGLWTAGAAVSFAIDWRTGAVVLVYMATMLAYTFYLKFQVILDVMVIAAGFVLRAMAGAYAIDVPISPWLYVVTALGALFLAITKRRAEVALLEGRAVEHRSTLGQYTPALLDQMTAMVTASTVIAYALYTFTAENLPSNHTMMLTIPFVLYGFFRYLYLVHLRGETKPPDEVLLRDRGLQVTLLVYAVAVLLVFYQRPLLDLAARLTGTW